MRHTVSGSCDSPLVASAPGDYSITVSGESGGWQAAAVSYSVQPDGNKRWAWSSNDEPTPWIQVGSRFFTLYVI